MPRGPLTYSELRTECERDYDEAHKSKEPLPSAAAEVGFKGYTITRSLKAQENKNIADATMSRNLLSAATMGDEVIGCSVITRL